MNENDITWETVNNLIDQLPDGPLKQRVENIQAHFIEMAANPEYSAERALLDFRNQLKITNLAGDLYNADRNWLDVFDLSEPTLKSFEDIATGLGYDNVDQLFGTNGFLTMNANELRARLEKLEPNVPFNKMLNYLTQGQVQHRRELILEGYDEDGNLKPLNWLASAVQGIFTPRVKEAYLRGEDPTWKDYVGDFLESGSMALPAGAVKGAATRAFGKAATKVAPKVAAKAGETVANIGAKVGNSPVVGRATKMGTAIADNAVSPALSQAYDYAMYDDPTNWRAQTEGWDFGRTALGTSTNILTPKMARAFGQGIASKMTDATGKADRQFVDFVSKGLANLGRDKEAEIAEATARRAGILKRVPSSADELTTNDIRRWANETGDILPTEQEYANALSEQAVSDWLDNVDGQQLAKIMANSSPNAELNIPPVEITTKDFSGFTRTPAGTVTTSATTLPTVETTATAGAANARKNPQLNGTTEIAPVTDAEAVKTIKAAIESNPDLQTKIARAAGRTTPMRDDLNLMGGAYLTNQLGSTMYKNDVGGVQTNGISSNSGPNAEKQKKAKETVDWSMKVPPSHEDIYRRKPAAYLQWRHGYRPKELTPEELEHLDKHTVDLIDPAYF